MQIFETSAIREHFLKDTLERGDLEKVDLNGNASLYFLPGQIDLASVKKKRLEASQEIGENLRRGREKYWNKFTEEEKIICKRERILRAQAGSRKMQRERKEITYKERLSLVQLLLSSNTLGLSSPEFKPYFPQVHSFLKRALRQKDLRRVRAGNNARYFLPEQVPVGTLQDKSQDERLAELCSIMSPEGMRRMDIRKALPWITTNSILDNLLLMGLRKKVLIKVVYSKTHSVYFKQAPEMALQAA